MRTSDQIYHQIRWDSRFQAADYSLGVQIRNGPVKEIPVLSFQPGGDIPWHRVLYIKGPRGLVWDRASGLDQLVPDDATRLSFPLSILLWNVCAGKHGRPLQQEPPAADIRVLLEVADNFCHQGYSYHHQELHVTLRYPPLSVTPVNLSPGKDALLIHYEELQVVAVHFTSNYRQPNQALRRQQWEALQPHLKAPWIILGDLNASDQEIEQFQVRDLTPPEPSHKNRRYQRILVSSDLDIADAQVRPSQLSDHHPISATLLKPERSYRHALAILPPYYQPIEDLRKLHDPAYDRWPAHLNLAFPGPSQPNYDQMRLALAEFPRFTLKFKNIRTFQHKSSVTTYWEPEDCEMIHRLSDLLGVERCTPHLTLAKTSRPVQLYLDPWEFEVRSLDHLIDQKLAHSIPLRPAHPLYDRIRHRCKALVVGSSIYLGDQDLDLVTTQLPQPLPEERLLPSLLRGPGYDLGDASHWQSVLDRDALFTYTHNSDFPERLRQLYDRLQRLGLKGQAWGLPGGLAWAVILATNARDYSQPIGLHRHDPSGKPMTVWSPHPPGTNLTAHVPRQFLDILTQSEYEPQPPYLELRAHEGMQLIVDLIKQYGARLRPFVHEKGCILSLQGVDPVRALRHAQKLGYQVSLRDG
ncbi:MAG: RNA repair domain-containing protein [Vulcanimicrobiota bacterium]